MRNTLLCIGAIVTLNLPAAAPASDNGRPASFAAVKVTVYPGQTITPEMVNLVPAGHFSGLGTAVTDEETLAGKIARRTLLPGQPIPQSAIREPFIVQQGKTVPLIFQSGNITITGAALALESGSAGDLINARNPDSGSVVQGIVQADGSLRTQ
ncbi:MAG: flagellar basal body P-ring formation chaperone FlgA [Rhodomicrobium sp.]